MKDNTIQASKFAQKYFQLLIKDFPQDKWLIRPTNVPSHALWQVGHLAFTCNAGLKALGFDSIVDDSWAELFGPGSNSTDDAADYPAIEVVIEKYNEAVTKLTEIYSNADDDVLGKATKIERLIERFPRQGDFIVFLLTSHLAIHAGQLSTLRKLLGLGNVM